MEKSETKLAAGEGVVLTVGRFGAFHAEVVRHQDSEMGVRFSDDVERITAMIGDRLPLCASA